MTHDIKELLQDLSEDAPGAERIDLDRQIGKGRALVRRRRRQVAGVSLVLTAGLVVGVNALPAGPPAQSQTAIPAPADRVLTKSSAKDLMLVAASYQTRAETTAGKFYRTRVLDADTSFRTGSGAAAYTVEQRTITETWFAADGSRMWFGVRKLGARPATPADEAKWRAAGSPTSWAIEHPDTASGKPITISGAASAPTLSAASGAAAKFYLGSPVGLTFQQVKELPTDPALLRQRLLRDKPSGTPEAKWLPVMLSKLLLDLPTPPQVRATAFKLLAGQPGAVVTSRVQDALRRPGTKVAWAGGLQLIVDPASGQLLSLATTDKPVQHLLLQSTWSNETPTAPPTAIR
ncbi:CU044_5270 family protein [Kribbella solani]|uniref:CU044_5270 family protein n=1 Tax=Kribbella solani TaxID=236067 RepID=UPI0029BED2C5|nr:CU044_5270 family protein [Kribbella solani]MDX3006257.1 CU044_5270 family protein [Kribbella solani]